MSKLDDLLGKKKEVVPILDLSKTIVHSKDEYKRLCERVPDYKMRPIKVNIHGNSLVFIDYSPFVFFQGAPRGY